MTERTTYCWGMWENERVFSLFTEQGPLTDWYTVRSRRKGSLDKAAVSFQGLSSHSPAQGSTADIYPSAPRPVIFSCRFWVEIDALFLISRLAIKFTSYVTKAEFLFEWGEQWRRNYPVTKFSLMSKEGLETEEISSGQLCGSWYVVRQWQWNVFGSSVIIQ